MRTELHSNPHKSVTSLEVLIAYDSVSSGKSAKELCDRLGEQLGSGYEVAASLWNLASLQHPILAHDAVRAAASASLVIIAVNAAEPLSAPVRSWLTKCICRMYSGGGALVALLYGIIGMEKEISPAYGFLKGVTQEAGVDLFSEVIEPADDDFDYLMESIHQRAHMRTTVLDAILSGARFHPVFDCSYPISESDCRLSLFSHLAMNTSCAAACNHAALAKSSGPSLNGHVQAQSSPLPARLTVADERPRILCADNLLILRPLYLRVLTQAGYEVTTADDGEEAWTALQCGDFDLLIISDEMPRLDGAELVARARMEGMSLPIIVAASDVGFFTDPHRRWPDIIGLQKPFGLWELTEAVGRVLCAAHHVGWYEKPGEECHALRNR
jgi:hypothetical protein